jgi:D-methionine transport system ATP-binding protein
VAVRDVSLDIGEGEIFGLIGHSGAGKSTLLRCINLLERPTAGAVYVDGIQLDALGPRQLQRERRKIGMIFQHFHLLNSATVAENVAFPLRLAGVSRRDAQRRVRELLEWVGLAGYEDKYPAQLSGGQKQRVAIARALAPDPKVLLCDEATSALDPQTTRAILELLLDINRRLGLTMVVVTHDMTVVQRICDRVAVMHQGQVIEQGRVADVFLKPQHFLTRQLVQEALGTGVAPVDRVRPHCGVLLGVSFVGEVTYEPVLAEVSAELGHRFSILSGAIDRVKDTPFGRLVVEWYGSDADVARAVERLRARGCDVIQLAPEAPAGVDVGTKGGH